MRYGFARAKDIVLCATYETLAYHSDFESFGAEEVAKRLDGHFSAGYVRRLLTSLSGDGLVTIDQYDESSPAHFTISDDGLKYVEELPSLAKLLDIRDSEVTVEVPAADRVVTLGHNQQLEIEEPLEEIIQFTEMANSFDGEIGLREITLGRLRAGRELVRAGVFSVRSLQLTLIVGLKMLVEKYEDVAIGAIAAKLLDMLLKQFGVV